MAYKKIVKSPAGYEYELVLGGPLEACAACGADLNAEPIAVCPDCGGMFCEKCVTDGTFDSHECEEDEPWDEEAE